MRQIINDIHAIRLTEQMYNVELFQPGDTTVTELSEEGITTATTRRFLKGIPVVGTNICWERYTGLLRFTGDNEVLLWEQDIYLNVRTARKDTRFSWG